MKSNLLEPQDSSSPELPRLPCAFHPQEHLTNFCCASQCLLPLCPECVSIHVAEHMASKTQPRLQHINDSIRELHSHLNSHNTSLNALYKQLVQAQGKVEQLREEVKLKLANSKAELQSSIEEQFRRLEGQVLQEIDELRYVRMLGKAKELTKRMILALKTTQRNFFSEQSKVTRMVIKFSANNISKKLINFEADLAPLLSAQPLSFKLSDIPVSIALKEILGVTFRQPGNIPEPKDLTLMLRELYEKPSQKRDKKPSFHKFGSSKNTPSRHESDIRKYETIDPICMKDFSSILASKPSSQSQFIVQNSEHEDFDFVRPSTFQSLDPNCYSSVKENIVQATKDFNDTIVRQSRLDSSMQPGRRRQSLSRGKGITLIHNKPEGRGHSRSFMKADLDLSLLNSQTQKIPRRFR